MELDNDQKQKLGQIDEIRLNSRNVVKLSPRDAKIIKLYQEGLSSYQIAAELGLNRHTVSKVLKVNDVSRRSSAFYRRQTHAIIIEMFEKGKTIEEIATKTELTKYTVTKVLEDNNLILGRREKEIMRVARYISMKNNKYPNDAIATFLGITEKQLNKLLRNSGIKVTSVRQKAACIEKFADVVEHCLKGVKMKEIALKYQLDLVMLRDIMSDCGLCHKEEE